MTVRLYYTDAGLRDFDATIVEVSDDGRRVYLDRTAFYPTSGGQLFDTGTLGSSHVVDVVDEDSRIAHVLDRELSSREGSVRGLIDWDRRFDHMQQHTGQHLLSAILEDAFGWKTLSVHFGDTTSTLDIDTENVRDSQMADAERRANEAIAANHVVTIGFEDAEAAVGLRKATERTGEIRVVTIDGLDRSACGGTHVRSTGEIGGLLLRRSERVKQGMRLEFVCGLRAVARARADFRALSAVAGAVSSALDDAPAQVEARLEAAREGEAVRRSLTKELDAYRARARYDSTAPDARGVRRVVEVRAEGTLEDLKGLAHAVCALPKSAFVGAIGATGQVLAGTSADSGLVAGQVLKDALAAAGGKGGGSSRMAQGAVAREKVQAILDAVYLAWDRAN